MHVVTEIDPNSGALFARNPYNTEFADRVAFFDADGMVRTVTGTTTVLSVLGADDGGESNLTYTWSVTSKPSGASNPTFSLNGINAAKSTTNTIASP